MVSFVFLLTVDLLTPASHWRQSGEGLFCVVKYTDTAFMPSWSIKIFKRTEFLLSV
jgi:hypothetical protein